MATMLTVVLFTLLSVAPYVAAEEPHRRFEYKHSFKGPHLILQDGTVPFWTHSGSAIPSDEQVRITPSLRSKRGAIWNKINLSFDSWDVEVVIRITGRGRVGADGMAIWYTDRIGQEGPVFGSNDQWNGLGVFLDSFDNDNQQNNPYIIAVTNDGTKLFDHERDGITQQKGGCLRDFRNKPFPVRIRLTYYQNTLTVYYHGGMTPNPEYELCTRVDNIQLPPNGYFGVSAATGGLADDHDVLAFFTHSLTTATAPVPQIDDKLTLEEQRKLASEFEDMRQKLEKAREEFKEKHPDQISEYEGMDENTRDQKNFESEYNREFRLVLETQNSLQSQLRDVGRKMDELLGKQERTLAYIGTISQGVQPQGQFQGQQFQGQVTPQPQAAGTSPIQRFEVEQLLTSQRDLLNLVRESRQLIGDIQLRAHNIETRQVTPPVAGGANPYDQAQQTATHELRDAVNNVRNDVTALLKRPQVMPQCPTTTCLSTMFFIVIIALQSVIFLAYSLIRSSQEARAKKFF